MAKHPVQSMSQRTHTVCNESTNSKTRIHPGTLLYVDVLIWLWLQLRLDLFSWVKLNKQCKMQVTHTRSRVLCTVYVKETSMYSCSLVNSQHVFSFLKHPERANKSRCLSFCIMLIAVISSWMYTDWTLSVWARGFAYFLSRKEAVPQWNHAGMDETGVLVYSELKQLLI